jgi:hypothetical protein
MAAMQCHDARGDREAESSTATVAVPCFRYAIECFEDSLERMRGDPGAMVTNGYYHAALIG